MADSPPSHSSLAMLNHLARLSRSQSEASLARVGLRPRHFVALTVLHDHAPATQQALATYLAIDRTNLVGLLNELESDGYIERRRASADRRRHIVVMTEAGEEALAAAEAAVAEAEDALLHGLAPEERRQLFDLLQRATTGHVRECSTEVEMRTGRPEPAATAS